MVDCDVGIYSSETGFSSVESPNDKDRGGRSTAAQFSLLQCTAVHCSVLILKVDLFLGLSNFPEVLYIN